MSHDYVRPQRDWREIAAEAMRETDPKNGVNLPKNWSGRWTRRTRQSDKEISRGKTEVLLVRLELLSSVG